MILIVCFFSLGFNSFTLFASGYNDRNENSCGSLDKWIDKYLIFIIVDTFQTMIIPFIIISISNVLIIYKLMNRFKDDSPDEERGSIIDRSRRIVYSLSKRLTNKSDSDVNHHVVVRTNHSNASKSEAIKILFLIATTFLLLNFPLAFTKTYQFFSKKQSSPTKNQSFNKNENISRYFNQSGYIENVTLTSEIVEQAFESFENNSMKINLTELIIYSKKFQIQEILSKISYFIYYINFSINFFLYSFKKKQFRNSFLKFFKNGSLR